MVVPQTKKAKLGVVADTDMDNGHANGGPVLEEELDFGIHGPVPPYPPHGSSIQVWEAFYNELVNWVRNVIPLGLKALGIDIDDVAQALPTKMPYSQRALIFSSLFFCLTL